MFGNLVARAELLARREPLGSDDLSLWMTRPTTDRQVADNVVEDFLLC